MEGPRYAGVFERLRIGRGNEPAHRDEHVLEATRIERPAHYETFGDFQYTYHYGDSRIPRIEQIEPLRQMCQHFIDCSLSGAQPLSSGESGLEVVRILEACSISLKANGGLVPIAESSQAQPVLINVMKTSV